MKSSIAIVFIAVLIIATGCSSSGDPITHIESRSTESGHGLMGLWRMEIDADQGTLDAVPIRMGELHLNVLPFLEPPAMVNLTIESVQFNGNIIDAEIGLRHPFLGSDEFTGFDVCGVMILSGTSTGFDDPDLRMPGDGDTRLLNPDGYTRWWNPIEFPVIDGLLGTPHSSANYDATLNPYKYFCDDLAPTDGLDSIDPLNRGYFSAGGKNIRHYTIEMGTQNLVFNYAIDANWMFPSGSPPYDVPTDFPEGANRPEAWRCEVTEIDNSLWNDGASSGGSLQVSIDVHDWFNAEMNSVKVECPGSFASVTQPVPSGGGQGYSTYEIEITDATPSEDSIDILIEVISESIGYEGNVPGEPVTAYFMHTALVSPDAPMIIYVDDSNTSGVEDGTMANPYNTIGEGIVAATAGYTVLVDDSGSAYNEHVDMKSDIVLKSSNWDDSDGTNRAAIDGPDDPETHSVQFLSVTDSAIVGFEIDHAGEISSSQSKMMLIDGGDGITIEDCHFTGTTDISYVSCIDASNVQNLVIANCRFSDLDKDTLDTGCSTITLLRILACPGVVIRNNIIADIRLSLDGSAKIIDILRVENSASCILKNNLVYNISPQAPDNASLLKVFYLIGCQNASLSNNTVDVIDTTNAFFINQCFAYWFEYCGTVATFTNNIATRIYSSGFPPPLARGVCAYYSSIVVADYTDTWDIGPGPNGANYHDGAGGSATPGIGAIYANPQYNDPDNEGHDFPTTSPAQQGDPSFVDWDDTGNPSNDPGDIDTNTRSRMGCFGGPGGEFLGLLS